MSENAGQSPDSRERELLSALMDGEAGEHELHQVLRAVGRDPALTGTWARWHVAQSALRGERLPAAGLPALQIDIRSAVSAAIDGEQAPARRRTPAWLQPLAGMAVAAGVAAMTVVSWQMLRTDSPDAVASAAADVQSVALGPMVVVREDGEELVVPVAAGESPTAGQDRLNAYLARHAQATSLGSARGLSPYARVVSLEGEELPAPESAAPAR